MTQSVSPDDLKKYLDTLANKLLSGNPSLAGQPGLIDKVVKDTTDIIRFKEQKSKHVVTKQQILDPEFIQKVSQTIIAQAVLNGSEEQKKFIAELIQAIDELRTTKSYQNELRSMLQEQEALLNDLNELMTELNEILKLDPLMLDKMQQKLRKKLQKRIHKKLLKRLEKLLAMRLNPNNKEALRDALRKLINEIKANIENLKKKNPLDKTVRPLQEDIYINLFGLLNSYITGSIAVPLTQYMGNGLGFNDWNPFHGYANIDKINELNFMFGDSLGLEAGTLRNLFAIEDDVVNELNDLLRTEGLALDKTAPTPFDTKNNPK